MPGSFPIHDLDDLGVQLGDAPRGDYTTIAGLVLVALGRIPESAGDRVELTDWIVEVGAVARNAITEVRIIARRTNEGADETAITDTGS